MRFIGMVGPLVLTEASMVASVNYLLAACSTTIIQHQRENGWQNQRITRRRVALCAHYKPR